jgi:hypothetical protein
MPATLADHVLTGSSETSSHTCPDSFGIAGLRRSAASRRRRRNFLAFAESQLLRRGLSVWARPASGSTQELR